MMDDKAKPIEIFRAGTHRPMGGGAVTISREELQATVDAYNGKNHEAPIVIGHPRIDAPAYGWIKSLSLQGDVLLGVLHQVEPQFAKLISEGRFKKVSASFYRPDSDTNPVPGVWMLKHVGMLGAAPPSVKGLKSVEMSENWDEAFTFGDPDTLAVDRAYQEQLTLLRNERFVDGLISEGRMLPVHRSGTLAFMASLGKADVVEFGEGEDRVRMEAGQWFTNFLTQLPRFVTFGRVSFTEAPDERAGLEGLKLPKGYAVAPDTDGVLAKADQYAMAHKVDFAEAVRAVSVGRS